MHALANSVSAVSKATPAAASHGQAAASVAQAGEVPLDTFAALLSQQLASTDPSAVQPDAAALEHTDAAQPKLEADSEPDAQSLTPDQLAQLLPLPALQALSAPTAVAPDLQSKVAAPAKDVLAAVASERKAALTAPGAGLAENAAAPAERQAVAEAPASVAAEAEQSGQARAEPSASSGRTLPAAADKPQTMPSVNDAAQPAQPAAVALAMPVPAALTQSRDAAPMPATSAIAAPVTSDIWGRQLGERVVWMVGQQHQGVELHLNPPSLGPLEIKLSLSDNQASLTFSTQHAPVREAIESATPRLREMLADSGVSLGSVSVNVGTPSQQQSAGYQAASDGARASHSWLPESVPEAAPLTTVVTRLPRNGMVDIFA